MTSYTRAQIRANREKWVAFLKDPKRRKAKSVLATRGGARCCLGHACYVLDPNRETGWDGFDSLPPEEIAASLGLKNEYGDADPDGEADILNVPGFEEDVVGSLVALNDTTKATPQQIGAYLETVIEGGPNTPFIPLTDYPE